jgi:hypothetical protein
MVYYHLALECVVKPLSAFFIELPTHNTYYTAHNPLPPPPTRGLFTVDIFILSFPAGLSFSRHQVKHDCKSQKVQCRWNASSSIAKVVERRTCYREVLLGLGCTSIAFEIGGEIGCGVGVVIRGVASVDGLGGKIGGVFEKGAWFGISGCLTVFPHPFSSTVFFSDFILPALTLLLPSSFRRYFSLPLHSYRSPTISPHASLLIDPLTPLKTVSYSANQFPFPLSPLPTLLSILPSPLSTKLTQGRT